MCVQLTDICGGWEQAQAHYVAALNSAKELGENLAAAAAELQLAEVCLPDSERDLSIAGLYISLFN